MKTGHKGIVASIFVVVLMLSFVGSVYAITGSIGNARMILRPEVGETIDRTILVKNVNDVPLDITLSVSGDLEGDVKLIDEEFNLAAGDERKARFTIKIKNDVTTETKINVQFSPVDGGNGVGLSSTIIIIPDESESTGSIFDIFGGSDDEEVVEGNPENGEVTFGKDKKEEVVRGVAESESGNLMAYGGGFTILLFVLLLALLVVASKHMKEKKGMGVAVGKSDKSDSSPVTKSKKEKASNE